MDEQPQSKEVLLIYVVSAIHWAGYYTLLALLHMLLEVSLLIVVPLAIIGLLILPPIFRIVKREDLDKLDE